MEAKRVEKTRGNGTSRVSLTLAFAAALTSTWNGVHIAGIKIADYFLVAGTVSVLLAAAINGRRLPIFAWAVLPPGSLLFIALIGSAVREDPLTSRYAGKQFIEGNAPVFGETVGALPLIARMALALTAVAIIVAGVSDNMQDRSVIVERLMRTWAAGAAISAAYGVINHIINIPILAHLPFIARIAVSRVSGLGNHPNSFGQALVTALPMLVYMFIASRGFTKFATALSLPITLYAIVLSESRAAILFGTIFAVVIFMFLVISGRRIHIGIFPIMMVLVPLTIVALPTALAKTRFFSSNGQESNTLRRLALARGIDMFNSNPLLGAGVGTWIAEMVPLIVLTSGGLLYLVIFYGSLTYPILVRPRSTGDVFVPMLVISAVSVFCYGLLGNGIYDRCLYWPFAALFALSLGQNPQTNAVRSTTLKESVDR